MTASPPLVAVDAVTTATFLLMGVTGARHRDRPGASAATATWLALAAATAVVAASRVGLVSSTAAADVLFVTWDVVVPLWAAFAFSNTGRGPVVTRRRLLATAVYVTILAAATLHGGAVDGSLGRSLRVLTSVLQVGLLGVGMFGVFTVARSGVATDLTAPQATTLAVGGLGVTLLSFSLGAVTADGTAQLPAMLTGFLAVTAGAFALGVYRFRLFDLTPGTGPLARRTVFEEMGEGMVVVDRDGILLDANASVEDALGVSVSEDGGRPARAVLGFALAEVAGDTASVRTRTGRRTFDVSSSTLTDPRGDVVGTSYLLQDVTDRQTREQRLAVLNRVLRHNLRNDLDAIRGFAEVLGDDAGDTADVAARINGVATELVEIGETVERADDLLARDHVDSSRVDTDSLLAEVASEIRSRHRVDVTTAGADGLVLRTDRTVLRTALLEVVENGVEHSDEHRPSVTIAVAETSGGVRITVTDDGPGIPEREQAVLLGAEETPLQHGTGVGLWFVSWALTRLGGDLSVAESGDAGSTVVLDIPETAAATPDAP